MKTKFFQILGVVAVSAMSFNSCTTDPCKDVDCGENGTCVEGICVCDAGYSGANCETEDRAKFIGTWESWGLCDSGILTNYIPTLTNGTSSTDVRITNFMGFDNPVNATVSGSTISIATQDPDSDGYTVSGSGTFDPYQSTINWSYTISYIDEGYSDPCASTWQRR